jgi:hypothetical protein
MFKSFFKPRASIIEEQDYEFEGNYEGIISEGKTLEDVRDAGIKVKSVIPLPDRQVAEFFNTKDAVKAAKILGVKNKGNIIEVPIS